MADLTPAEQAFFATGDASHLQNPAPGAQGVDNLAPSVTPTPSANGPLERQALAQAPAPQAPAPSQAAAPAPAAPQQPSPDDSAEVLRRQLAATQQQAAMLEGQLRGILAAAQQQPQQPAAQPPDQTTDPIGYMMFQNEQMQKQLLALQQHQVTTVAQQQQLAALQAFQAQVQQLKQEFVSSTPDYDAAVQHLRNTRVSDLRMFGMSDHQIAQQIASEEWGLAEAAISAGQNPAKVIYEMSRRHGYVAQAPAGAPGQPPIQPKQGASVADIQRAQAAAASLPSNPAPATDITVENLRNASDSDLNKLVLDPKAWEQIAGGNNYPL